MKDRKKETSIGAMTRLNLEWSDLAKLTAKTLSYLPTEPASVLGLGLLDVAIVDPIDPEKAYPLLDWSLKQLAIVSTFIEGYARTTELMLEKQEGQAVLTALAQLSFIKNSRYVPPDIKRELPINIAAIVRTASAANRLKSKPGERRPMVDRRGALRKAVEEAVRSNEDNSTSYILNLLIGSDKGVVTELKDDKVYFWRGNKLVSVGLDRFENICVDARQAKEQGKRSRIKKPSTG